MMRADDEAAALVVMGTGQRRKQQRVGGLCRQEDGGDEDWVDKTMRLARNCNSLLFADNGCRGLCNGYVDKQVEFERRQESRHTFSSSASVGGDRGGGGDSIWNRATGAAEVELYRQFLFDEESVVEGLQSRQECEHGVGQGDLEKENREVRARPHRPYRRVDYEGEDYGDGDGDGDHYEGDDDEHRSTVTQRTH